MTILSYFKDAAAFWRTLESRLSSKQVILRQVMSFSAIIDRTWASSIFPCGMTAWAGYR
jgi:hypothetical protein